MNAKQATVTTGTKATNEINTHTLHIKRSQCNEVVSKI